MREETFDRVVLPSQFRFRQRCMKFLVANTMQENRLLAALEVVRERLEHLPQAAVRQHPRVDTEGGEGALEGGRVVNASGHHAGPAGGQVELCELSLMGHCWAGGPLLSGKPVPRRLLGGPVSMFSVVILRGRFVRDRQPHHRAVRLDNGLRASTIGHVLVEMLVDATLMDSRPARFSTGARVRPRMSATSAASDGSAAPVSTIFPVGMLTA